MEGATGLSHWTVGCAENLSMQVAGVPFKVHAHVVQDAPFQLLLGRPFLRVLLCRIEELRDGKVEVSIRDPTNSEGRIYLPSRARKSRAPHMSSFTTSIPTLVTAKIGVPRESATQVTSVIWVPANGECGVVRRERGYA